MRKLISVTSLLGLIFCSTLRAETLFLDVFLNGVKVKELVQFEHDQTHFWSDDNILQTTSLAEYATGLSGRIDYCALNAIQCEYDVYTQRLYLTAELGLFPAQRISSITKNNLLPTKSSGALLNYDAYLRDFSGGVQTLDLLQQWRGFGNYGIVETTANYRHYFGNDAQSGTNQGLVRYDSFWQYNDETNMRFWRVGDMVSGSSGWARQVRMGGVKFSRRFELDPQFVRYPYPEFAGSAVLPSDVEIFINSSKLYAGQVAPGPFILDSEPTITGLATATIVTTDITGQAVSREVEFYIAPDLLRKGVLDYDLNLGVLRQNFGIRSFDYGSSTIGIADLRYGLSDTITLGGHAEVGAGIYNLGGGTDFNLANLGVISLATAYGKNEQHGGWLGLFGYRFQARNWGVAFKYKQQQQTYQDIGTTQLVLQNKREIQLNAAYSFNNGVSMGVGYFALKPFDGQSRRLLSIFYNQSFETASLSASLNWDAELSSKSFGINVSFPLGNRYRANTNVQKDTKGKMNALVSVNQARVGNQGLRWAASAVVGSGDYSVSGGWKGRAAEYSGGIYDRGDSKGYFAQASGAIVWAENTLLLGNRIADAFAIVSTGGLANVPVVVENQLVGESDSNGLLLVTGLASYNPVNIGIHTKPLPIDINVVNDRITIMTAAGHGAKVNFELYQTYAAIVIVQDEDGKPIPVGSIATINNEDSPYFVGWDGELYLERLQSTNTVTLKNGKYSCVISFNYEVIQNDIPVLGPYVCDAKEN
ncbi:fimbria/pilus outer membrane usher protein [Alishewanella sp. SMS8]|uniref:fimbria/pilus outer membrane usher protein n=1 Tax=Alishewanella sp. SMS8 TaxID=2994676 RepID=UPI0027418A3B|nr:fimbria/pilus outer membrane usher protein [Alishewanella sp. SMS8]MDP5458059.1 fimbria/pilus outer membrane usher protein [Alishewanella sp. SMS8]